MKKALLTMILAGASLAATLPAAAENTVLMLPIAGAMAANDAQARLGDNIKFYFGDQKTPKVLSKIGTDKTSQRTNGFGKGAEKSCNWVFLSAMLALKKKAEDMGANAVINIVSNFNNEEKSSQTEFECQDGAIMSGVALKGDFVKIAQ